MIVIDFVIEVNVIGIGVGGGVLKVVDVENVVVEMVLVDVLFMFNFLVFMIG